jgi:hypothetical protein
MELNDGVSHHELQSSNALDGKLQEKTGVAQNVLIKPRIVIQS